jgi:transcriptional regulator with XRE-family HTH domain
MPRFGKRVERDRNVQVETARDVLKGLLRRGPVSLDEIGRRMGHTRGYMSRALQGLNPLRLETILEALAIAGIEPAEYFGAAAKALAPVEVKESMPSQEQIDDMVLRSLRRLGWAPVGYEERRSGAAMG